MLGSGKGGGGVLPVVPAGQTGNSPEVHDRGFLTLGIIDQDAVDDIDASVNTRCSRNTNHHLIVGGFQIFIYGAAAFVINTDDGGARRRLAVEN